MALAQEGFGVFELRPLNVADLLDTAVRIYRLRFGPLLSICAVVAGPLGALQIAATSSLFAGALDQPLGSVLPNLSLPVLIALGVYGLLFWVTMPLMQAAVAKAVAQFYLGAEARVADAYRFALRKWFALLVIMLIIALLTTAIALAVMIPLGIMIGALVPSATGSGGHHLAVTLSVLALALVMLTVALLLVLYVSLKLYFAGLVAVLEDTGPVTALQRSWQLTHGHLLRVFVTVSVLWLMVAVARAIVTWPAQLFFVLLSEKMSGAIYAVVQGLSVLMQVLTQPLLVTGTVLLYYDLRIRKEAFDLTAMAEAIGQPDLARPAREQSVPGPLFETEPGPSAREDSDGT